jgi:hypothetical protein
MDVTVRFLCRRQRYQKLTSCPPVRPVARSRRKSTLGGHTISHGTSSSSSLSFWCVGHNSRLTSSLTLNLQATNLPLTPYIHLPALVCAFAMLISCKAPVTQISIFEIFHVEAKYLPALVIIISTLSLATESLNSYASKWVGLGLGRLWYEVAHRNTVSSESGHRGQAPQWMRSIVGDGYDPDTDRKPPPPGGPKRMGTINDTRWGVTPGDRGKFTIGGGCTRSMCN